ncbi:transcriptional regulator [Planomonospora sp. ID91781]|uniref:NBR1-Ig-like domain-containing protein n=1 Tax=Planomonospora sp. ID91781 TaxID=2738135 RepID=UPI0018C37FC8|nr:NBR1-Ig-like domain-containing protein [Planomonospora sp. ID91781]MBG0824160.1 transcriptional regulator [Planomonospora sp. ID91781]
MALLAHRLWELKERAGDPSFAEMSSRLGAAASKSSLAAAARGRTLPTWETTWEFVRVLAVDRLGQDERETEREWRSYWEQAGTQGPPASPAAESEPTQTGPARTGTVAEPAEGGLAEGGSVADGPAPAARPLRIRIGRPVVLGVLSAVLAGGAGALVAAFSPFGGEKAPDKAVPHESPAWTAQSSDDSVFEGDVTYPDGSTVRRKAHFTKVWRIRNAGTVPWEGRYLTRINSTPCRAPERIAIEPTAPGRTTDIAVRVRAAAGPARCKIFWKMTSEDGTPLFPAKKPIFLDVSVQ